MGGGALGGRTGSSRNTVRTIRAGEEHLFIKPGLRGVRYRRAGPQGRAEG